MKPTWRLAGAILLWLVLEWYGASSEVSWLFLLAAWVLALIAGSMAYALWNRAGLRLEVAVKASRPAPDSPAEELPEQLLRTSPVASPVFERDGMDVDVGLGTARGSRGPAWVRGSIGGEELHFGAGVVPPGGWSRTTELKALRRGAIGATGWTITTSDPLGFFRGERCSPDAEVALVLPRFASLAHLREPRKLEASAAAPRAGSGNEVFGIREYRPGDSLRRIHWRSSARHGDLVVREYEPPGLQTLTIVVDPAPASVEVADQIARLAASEAWDCIREGGRVVIWGPGLEPVGSSRDLWSILEWLSRYPAPPSGGFEPSHAFGGGAAAGSGEELVIILASPNSEAVEVAEAARRPRGWVVGDVDLATDIPLQRVGTGWPL
jgi:uncharacterized protein (DUF58 family)